MDSQDVYFFGEGSDSVLDQFLSVEDDSEFGAIVVEVGAQVGVVYFGEGGEFDVGGGELVEV